MFDMEYLLSAGDNSQLRGGTSVGFGCSVRCSLWPDYALTIFTHGFIITTSIVQSCMAPLQPPPDPNRQQVHDTCLSMTYNAPHQRTVKRSAFLCENGAIATRTKRRVALRVRWMRLLCFVFTATVTSMSRDHRAPTNLPLCHC